MKNAAYIVLVFCGGLRLAIKSGLPKAASSLCQNWQITNKWHTLRGCASRCGKILGKEV